jgi:hypothetical protein
MTYVKVIGTFEDTAAANDARAALIAANLADDGTMWTEPERMDIDLHPPRSNAPDRGRTLLIATVRDELAPAVANVMAGRADEQDVEEFRQLGHQFLARDGREVVHSPSGATRELECD